MPNITSTRRNSTQISVWFSNEDFHKTENKSALTSAAKQEGYTQAQYSFPYQILT